MMLLLVQASWSCSCHQCVNYSDEMSKCRCCVYHMVGGKRSSPPALADLVGSGAPGDIAMTMKNSFGLTPQADDIMQGKRTMRLANVVERKQSGGPVDMLGDQHQPSESDHIQIERNNMNQLEDTKTSRNVLRKEMNNVLLTILTGDQLPMLGETTMVLQAQLDELLDTLAMIEHNLIH